LTFGCESDGDGTEDSVVRVGDKVCYNKKIPWGRGLQKGTGPGGEERSEEGEDGPVSEWRLTLPDHARTFNQETLYWGGRRRSRTQCTSIHRS